MDDISDKARSITYQGADEESDLSVCENASILLAVGIYYMQRARPLWPDPVCVVARKIMLSDLKC